MACILYYNSSYSLVSNANKDLLQRNQLPLLNSFTKFWLCEGGVEGKPGEIYRYLVKSEAW